MPGQVRTDLSAGVAESRAARDVGPDEVAAEILSALRRPRFDVYVPRSIGPLTTFNGAIPRRARDRLRAPSRSTRRSSTPIRAARGVRAARSAATPPASAPEKQLEPELPSGAAVGRASARSARRPAAAAARPAPRRGVRGAGSAAAG